MFCVCWVYNIRLTGHVDERVHCKTGLEIDLNQPFCQGGYTSCSLRLKHRCAYRIWNSFPTLFQCLTGVSSIEPTWVLVMCLSDADVRTFKGTTIQWTEWFFAPQRSIDPGENKFCIPGFAVTGSLKIHQKEDFVRFVGSVSDERLERLQVLSQRGTLWHDRPDRRRHLWPWSLCPQRCWSCCLCPIHTRRARKPFLPHSQIHWSISSLDKRRR